MIGAWVGLVVAIVATAFFTIAELALLSVSRLELRRWVHRTLEGETWVRATDVIEYPYRLISPILAGRALAVTAASIFAASLAARVFERGPLTTATLAALLLAPTMYVVDAVAGGGTRARAHQLFPAVSLALRASSWIFRPLVVAADEVARLFQAGKRAREPTTGRRVVEALLDESERAGVVEPSEREIITGVFEFGRTPVGAVMKPFDEVIMAPAGSSAREISRLIRESGYSRIPLHGRHDARRIVGMVHVFDLYKIAPDESPHPRRVVMTDTETPCDELLVEMKRRRCHLAIVVEGKHAVGMVTMEDLVEELVGEIRDEHDARAESRQPPLVVDAHAPIVELNSKYDIDLPVSGSDTVEDLLVAVLGRMPHSGEELRIREWAVEVLDATEERVRRVRLRRRTRGTVRGSRATR